MPGLHREVGRTSEKSAAIVSNGGIGRRLLKVEDAAEYLGLSVDTLHKWVQGAGDSSRQGWSCVAFRSSGT